MRRRERRRKKEKEEEKEEGRTRYEVETIVTFFSVVT